MFLKKLIIRKGEIVIREISFRKGVNLIVDETDKSNLKMSGNNVGKTTVFRLIDFCLGSDGRNIYTDSEFRTANNEVESFLKNSGVEIVLIIQEVFDDDSNRIVIERNFRGGVRNNRKINGTGYGAKDFENKLKLLLFKTDVIRPTFRQMISKNIRYEKERLENTVKVLHNTVTKEEYESLFLFWLGISFNDAARKSQLTDLIKIESNFQKKIKREFDLPKIEQALTIIDRDIEELTKKKESFQINDDHKSEIDKLNKVKFDISQISTDITRLRLRQSLITEGVEELNGKHANIDVDVVKSLYEEAKLLIPDVQKSFEDTLSFHNQMVMQKVAFLSRELPQLISVIEEKEMSLNSLLVSETKITASLSKKGVFEGLGSVIVQLNDKYERKGIYEEQRRLLTESIDREKNYREELDGINNGIQNKQDMLTERIKEFNNIFSQLSKELYGEQFILVDEHSDRAISLKVETIDTNPGTGKKKGQIAAFDLAYIKFADASGLNCLHFILQDQLETVHVNQLNSLFTSIVEGMNCQYVMTILKDKLPTDIDVNPYVILRLSQQNKLFKL